MNDDEFLNDRDCPPKGETPKTDAAMFSLDDGTDVTKAGVARELERELANTLRVSKEGWRYADELNEERKRLTEALAQALWVVEAAKSYADCDDHDSAKKLKHAFWEWEAGR
jgi:hypothetical protein